WIDAWADANAAISPAFLRDLQADYPAVWRRYRQVISERKRHGMVLLRPLLRADVNDRVAFSLLNHIFNLVQDPDFADQLNVSRREALRGAVSIWAGGALLRVAKAKPSKSNGRATPLRKVRSR
ncbi:MAG TPA: hypothetical protein VMF89_36320, partial [Polyangiales bacterium]|nr:hypothetical protein [Polyangiales bacterium]